MPRSRRERATLAAVLCTGIACCAATATAQTVPTTGGAAMPVVIPPTPAATGYGAPGTRSLIASSSSLLGRIVDVRGTMPGAANRRVILQRLDPRRGWRRVARTRVRSSERFVIRWHTDRSGRLSLRAIVAPLDRSDRRRRARRALPRAPAPVVGLTIFRPAMASFYGPGFFGRQTACGLTLTPDLHGVAHRSLPCGTLVEIMYRSREITVPVIDRGPFSGTYSWDLTQATADALGFQGSGSIGYVRADPAAPGPAPAPAPVPAPAPAPPPAEPPPPPPAS
ncbi:MAG: rare lipoprotein [Solirubrobacteraceae bacterium]|nr:rare lipoprotein [Solirubrobacteraceae bacterium]